MRKLAFLLPLLVLLLDLSFGALSFPELGIEPRILFLALWMISWWIFGVAPLGITALIPLVYLPTMQLLPLKAITAYYSDPVIFLFLGGFMLARGLEKTELSERFALGVLKLTGRSDVGIVVGFIAATAIMSMWISNTATAIMMVPIAYSVLNFLKENTQHQDRDFRNLTTVIYISIAYAANIGGTATPIGSPPNVIFVGYLKNLYEIKIDFWRWMLIMTPVCIVFLTLQYFLLRKLFPFSLSITQDFRLFLNRKLESLAPFNSAQKFALVVFGLTCGLWIFKDIINLLTHSELLNDTSIAILAGLALFCVPFDLKNFRRILDETDIPTLPWDIILLFGGGMALAGVLEKFGAIQSVVTVFEKMPIGNPYLLVFGLSLLALLLTEVMSNVALCVVALPLFMSVGKAQGLDPLLIGLPAAICTSYAFSLPISTPPNAIVFGTRAIQMKDMFRAGMLMNILGVLSVMTIGWILMKALL